MNGVERSNDGVVLRRCPFCGGEAIIESESIGKEKYLYSVSCINDCVTQGIYHKTVDSAIKEWNTRKPIKNLIEKLENEVKDLREDCNYIDAYKYEEAIKIIKEELM